jgi:hypothetical protein
MIAARFALPEWSRISIRALARTAAASAFSGDHMHASVRCAATISPAASMCARPGMLLPSNSTADVSILVIAISLSRSSSGGL